MYIYVYMYNYYFKRGGGLENKSKESTLCVILLILIVLLYYGVLIQFSPVIVDLYLFYDGLVDLHDMGPSDKTSV